MTITRDVLSYKPTREVFSAIGRYHYLTVPQLQRLLYQGRLRSYVQGSLNKLQAAGYVDSKDQTLVSDTGRPLRVWTFTTQGARTLSQMGFSDLPVMHQRLNRSAFMLDHDLDVNDAMIVCELLSTRYSVELIGFKTDNQLHKTPTSVILPDGSKTNVIPDGWVCYGFGGTKAAYAIEVDRGTENRFKWQNKVRSFVAFASGNPSPYEIAFGEKSLTVLVIVKPAQLRSIKEPQARLEDLKRWTEAELLVLGKQNWGSLFRFTVQRTDQTDPSIFFGGAHWVAAFDPTPRSLLEGVL